MTNKGSACFKVCGVGHHFGKAISQSKCVASATNKKDIGTIWRQTNKGRYLYLKIRFVLQSGYPIEICPFYSKAMFLYSAHVRDE